LHNSWSELRDPARAGGCISFVLDFLWHIPILRDFFFIKEKEIKEINKCLSLFHFTPDEQFLAFFSTARDFLWHIPILRDFFSSSGTSRHCGGKEEKEFHVRNNY
jgi:hypothetical protein